MAADLFLCVGQITTTTLRKAERFAKANYRQIYDAWPRHAMRNIEPQPTSLEAAKGSSLARSPTSKQSGNQHETHTEPAAVTAANAGACAKITLRQRALTAR